MYAPSAEYGGFAAHRTIHDKAAALLRSLAIDHPFLDGNKRTAVLACIVFLDMNGYELQCPHDQAIRFVLRIVKYKPTVHYIARWLRRHTRKHKQPRPQSLLDWLRQRFGAAKA